VPIDVDSNGDENGEGHLKMVTGSGYGQNFFALVNQLLCFVPLNLLLIM